MKQVIAAALAVFMASPVMGQEQCGVRTELTAWLSEEYGETMQSAGIMPSGSVFETWANVETGTFTVLLTEGATSCMVIAGNGFARVDEDPAPQGERM